MGDLKVHILFRFSKKTGKIDTTMTGLGSAQMQLWALNNTTPSKCTMIIEQVTGNVIFMATGSKDGFPKVEKSVGHCTEYGLPFEFIQSIEDDRFN